MRIIKDFESIVYSVVDSFRNVNGGVYWDTTDGTLDALIKHLSNPEHAERQVIRGILREKNPRSILDVACGSAVELDGYGSNGIGISYFGFDRSLYMIDTARAKHPDTGFVLGDVNSLPFQDNSFDAVLLKHILEHLPDYKTAVQEALRVSNSLVIINFFHRLLPFNIPIWNGKGYHDNWYKSSTFHNFLKSLPISGYQRIATYGTSGQTAEIYVLEKLPS